MYGDVYDYIWYQSLFHVINSFLFISHNSFCSYLNKRMIYITICSKTRHKSGQWYEHIFHEFSSLNVFSAFAKYVTHCICFSNFHSTRSFTFIFSSFHLVLSTPVRLPSIVFLAFLIFIYPHNYLEDGFVGKVTFFKYPNHLAFLYYFVMAFAQGAKFHIEIIVKNVVQKFTQHNTHKHLF